MEILIISSYHPLFVCLTLYCAFYNSCNKPIAYGYMFSVTMLPSLVFGLVLCSVSVKSCKLLMKTMHPPVPVFVCNVCLQ